MSGVRPGERRERTAQRVSLMRHLCEPRLARSYWIGDIARLFGVPLRMLVSWPSRHAARLTGGYRA